MHVVLLHCEIGEENTTMKKLNNLIWNLRIIKDTKGQDLIEYALMAGFVAVAAGAIMPNVATSISTIFNKINNTMSVAASQGAS
jgi:pilus assembly protein Flp/PilA